MTGMERTLSAIEYRETDRVPVVGGFVRHPEFLARSAAVTVEQFWADPKTTAISAFRNLGVDVIIGLILPARNSAVGAEMEYAHPDQFSSPEDLLGEIVQLPSLSELHRSFDHRAAYAEYVNRYVNGQRAIGEDVLWIPNTLDCVCQFQHEAYFGAENYYMALALYPDEMKRLFEHSGELAFLKNQAVAKAMVDHNLPRVMWLGQDACDCRGPYISPEQMRDIYLRYVKRSLEPLKDIGVKIIWHSDGNIMPIVQYLIEAGVDGFQGLQETVDVRIDINELADLRTLSGAKAIIVGSISGVTTMPFGTPEDVCAEVDRCVEIARRRRGGWLLNFSSSLGPEVPAQNIQAFFDHARRA